MPLCVAMRYSPAQAWPQGRMSRPRRRGRIRAAVRNLLRGTQTLYAMIYGYIRVSSDKQTVENQRFEINRFCQQHQLSVDGWIAETISGAQTYGKRKLGALLAQVTKGDIIICSELSRLGRNLFMIMEILNICMARECRVWTIKDNYRLGDDIPSKVLAFAFGLSAEIERKLISQRTKEAMARRKAEGAVLGRPSGRRTAPGKLKLHGRERYIAQQLGAGVSLRELARRLHVDRGTLARFVKRFALNNAASGAPEAAERGD